MNKTDTQRTIFEQLVYGPLAADLTQVLYTNRKAQDSFYVEFAYKVKEPLPDKGDAMIEHDSIMLLLRYGVKVKKRKNGKENTETMTILDKDVISIEIKSTESDIQKSSVAKYLGATRLFFIAAPANLLRTIIDKYYVASRQFSHIIGLIDSDAGRIVVLPQFQNFDRDRRDRLLSHCYTSVHRIPQYNDTEPFAMHRVSCLPGEKVNWIDVDGVKVNMDYIKYF